MIYFLFQIIYFLIPAAFANMAPVFVKNHFKSLAYPVDLNKKFLGNRLFGSHKTFRGFIFGVLASMMIVFFQVLLYNNFIFFQELTLLDERTNIWLFGFLTGFGVLFGDLIGSFIKRRLNIASGKSLLILDQVNAVIGLAIFAFPFYFESLKVAIGVIFVWFIGHFVIRYIGFLVGLNKAKL